MKRAVLALVGLLLVLTGCATASTGPDVKAVHQEGGIASAKKTVDCLDPSTRSGYNPGDSYFGYPARQVSFDASTAKGAERGRFTIVSKDNVELYQPVSVTFNLVPDCDTLIKFHNTIGARYKAYLDDASGSSADYPQGWVDLLNFVIGKPLDQTLDRIAQEKEWRLLWNDPTTRTEVETEVTATIETLVNRQAGGDFFENFNVLLQKPDPVNEALVDAISAEAAGIAQARAAEEKAKADEIAAKAQEALAVAQAKTRKAEIEGYGGIDAWLMYQCIQKSCNPYQPTYLLAGGAAAKQ